MTSSQLRPSRAASSPSMTASMGPPMEGGGLVATSQSPSWRVSGVRTTAWYAARSAAVTSPPREAESAAIRAASSPV